MLSNGRNDLKKCSTLEELIMLPITVPFTLSPEMKGAQECSEKIMIALRTERKMKPHQTLLMMS